MFGGGKIKLDKEVMEKAAAISRERGYSSVEEFVTHLIEREARSSGPSEDEEAVKEKLQGLGYIS